MKWFVDKYIPAVLIPRASARTQEAAGASISSFILYPAVIQQLGLQLTTKPWISDNISLTLSGLFKPKKNN